MVTRNTRSRIFTSFVSGFSTLHSKTRLGANSSRGSAQHRPHNLNHNCQRLDARFPRMTSTVLTPAPGPASPGLTRIALCQMPVSANKAKNLLTAQSYLGKAAETGAKLAILPECFNCPYDTSKFAEYAEKVGEVGDGSGSSRTVEMLCAAARDSGMYIIGGSLPEISDDGSIYNTSVSISSAGAIVAKHRKVHLFDIDCSLTGGIVFKESDALSAGSAVTVFDASTVAEGMRVGVGICYDIRFPDLSMAMVRDAGASLLVFPGAFNMTTGPAHWELLARARAVDNQTFVAVCSPARWDETASYTPWGHSSVVDPWGQVVATTDHGPGIVFADLDLPRIEQVRASIPTSRQRRPDVYKRVPDT
jgi:omega-amidase